MTMTVRRQSYQKSGGVCVPLKAGVAQGRWSWHSVPSFGASWCVVLLLLSQAARAQEASVEVLHEFNPFLRGANPQAALVQGTDGSFYGTTAGGGASEHGTIFKLDSTGVFTTLHHFQGSDGANPQASLTPGEGGSFYGTTYGGGAGNGGTIFRLRVGGMRLPGDCNADGSRNLSDAVCLVGFLSLGAPQSLPCGSGLPEDGANLHLLDHNGDLRLDLADPVALLSFLFVRGPPPGAGLDCVAIPGCSAACPR